MSELQLQEGKSYYDRTGRRHGPVVQQGKLFRSPDKNLWYANGRWSNSIRDHDLDLVREAKADDTQVDFKLEDGKRYYSRAGIVHGPLEDCGRYFASRDKSDPLAWLPNGRVDDTLCQSEDLCREVKEVEHQGKSHVGGLVNSKVPPYHLIPPVVFRVLAGRFQRGQQNLGDKAWNAQSADQSPLRDRAALLERINHLQNHLLRLQEDLAAGKSVDIAEDPAAILWGGAFIVASIDAVSREGRG